MNPEYAGFWRRLLAVCIDLPWLLLPLSVFSYIHSKPWQITWDTLTWDSPQLIEIAFIVGIPFLLIIWCWWRWAATPGQLLFNCEIVHTSGQPMTLGRALLRGISVIFSVLPFGLGLFWMLWDKRQQTWHDKIARTLVIIHDESSVPIERLMEGN